MGNNSKAQYVDADKLQQELNSLYPNVVVPYSGAIESQIGTMIQVALIQTLTSFKAELAQAIKRASVPYDKCLLCVQRDSCIPDHPLGENR